MGAEKCSDSNIIEILSRDIDLSPRGKRGDSAVRGVDLQMSMVAISSNTNVEADRLQLPHLSN